MRSISTPRVPSLAFPGSQHGVVELLNHKLSELDDHRVRFAGVLSLFDFSTASIQSALNAYQMAKAADPTGDSWADARVVRDDAMEYPRIWKKIAARDGAITIWDFGTALYAAIKHTASLKSLEIENRHLDRIAKAFSSKFPDAKHVRHGVGHPSDISNTPKRNVASGSFKNASMAINKTEKLSISGIFGRDVVVTIEKRIVKCTIDQNTLDSLVDIEFSFYELVQPAVDRLRPLQR